VITHGVPAPDKLGHDRQCRVDVPVHRNTEESEGAGHALEDQRTVRFVTEAGSPFG
jgi:hypothetical protein